MSAENVLYIIVAAVVALGITAFIYGYKSKLSPSLKWILGALRFLSLFTLFVLLINPKLRSVSYTLVKPKLPVVVDISSSIAALEDTAQVRASVNRILNDADLNEAFDISAYGIGDEFQTLDSLRFDQGQSRLEKVFESLEEVYSDQIAPTILLTDGNQTYGSDFQFAASTYDNQVFPVVLGDTIHHIDLKIAQLNTNRYSFLKNEFPVEAVLVYNGGDAITSRFVLRKGNAVVHSETVRFDTQNNTKTLSVSLPSAQVGLQRYTAVLEPLAEEKNTQNNYKRFAVEVIDQATNILLISDIIHPDLGAFRKAIETNEQRQVRIAKPLEAASILEDYQLLILYQPTEQFRAVLTAAQTHGSNILWVTGSKTNWNFLNASQGFFQKEFARVNEEVGAKLNLNYGNYALEDIDFSDFPPLVTAFGEVTIEVPNEVLLQQEIDGITTGSPMLATFDLNGRKMGLWDAENIWKWRSRTYLENSDFQLFDGFVGKLVQYLASNKRRSRLEVTHETFYYNDSPVLVSAQYFDKNFVFDNRAQLEIRTTNQETEEETVVPLLLKNNFYEVDLTTLAPGDYSFTVSVQGEGLARSGNFTILEFNVEEQFLNADVTKLHRVATNTGGKLFTLNQLDDLIQTLTTEESYRPIQRSQRKIVPLIEWKYLLALLALTLAAEWFIRKYNGLI